MYSFAQRPDTTVVDEPLYAHYLRVSGADHPGRDQVLASQDTDGGNVMARLLENSWSTPLVFHKQMAHHLVDLDLGFLDDMDHVFLIRPPREMLPSLARVLGNVNLRDTGLPAQLDLLEALEQRGREPVCLDGSALRRAPGPVLKSLCDRLGIGYVAAMLRWPAGPRPEDGVWARWWYASVHESTGFRPGAAAPADLPEAVAHLLDPCLAIYGKLSTYAVSHED